MASEGQANINLLNILSRMWCPFRGGSLCIGLEKQSPSVWECLICKRISKSSEEERRRVGVRIFDPVLQEDCVVKVGESSWASPPLLATLETHYQSNTHRRCVEAFLLLGDQCDEVRYKVTFWLEPFIACLPNSEQRGEIQELARKYRNRGADSTVCFANALIMLQTHMKREIEESIQERFRVLIAKIEPAVFLNEDEAKILLKDSQSFEGDHLNLVVSLVQEYLPEFSRPAFTAPTAKSLAERHFSALAKRIMITTASSLQEENRIQSSLVAHIDEIIGCGAVPHLGEFVSDSCNRTLQREAVWAMSRITSGIPEHTKAIVQAGAIPVFVQLLSNSDDDIRELSVQALGSIAPTDYRNVLVEAGALQELVLQVPGYSKLSLLRSATWTLRALCKGKPRLCFEALRSALSVLAKLVLSSDEEVLIDSCSALADLPYGSDKTIQAVIESGICSRLVDLLLHPNQDVQSLVLTTLENVTAGSNQQTQVIVDANVLPCLWALLSSSNNSICSDACWVISNITGGNKDQIQAVFDNDIVQPLVQLLSHTESEIRKQAAWAVSNAAVGGSFEQIEFLAQQGSIGPLCDVLTLGDADVVTRVLQALKYMLKLGKEQSDVVSNQMAVRIREADGVKRIEEMRRHECSRVRKLATELISDYFLVPEKKKVSVKRRR
jgi:importin subunit alpha-6/7